jgi:3-oxoacyl-[acyl-carrier protein] reductase
MRFDGQVALLTGAGRGIGAATARRLASEGAAVVVSDVDITPAQRVVDEIVAGGGRGRAIACDVTARPAVDALFQESVGEFGTVDILVACAGILRDNLVHKMTEDDWDSVIDTHLKGTYLAAQAAQRKMVEQKRGKMVFISSTSALGNRGQTNYSAAKAGLQGMARTLALELGRFNINVNAVAPGFVDTRMARSTAERIGVDYETFMADTAADIPLGRIGTPEDVAAVITFLASDDARYVSGQTLYVRGGP